MVIIGAVVLDPLLGVVKTALGIKEGRIVALGRAGNPETMDEIAVRIGPQTEIIAAHGLLATPGGIDSHVHLITPRLIPVALAAGLTTLITAGWEEPLWRWERTIAAFEALPVNIGLQATARSDDAAATERLIVDLACPGLKVHEDFAAYPEIVDATLALCETHDIQLCLHTDGLHECGRARGDGRRDRRPDDARLPRRGRRRRPHARPDQARRRAERDLLLDQPRHPLGPRLGRRAPDDDAARPRAEPRRARPRRDGPRADPPGDDGRRGTAARAGRDPDHRQRLAGDGPHRRVDPQDLATGPRDEDVAAE